MNNLAPLVSILMPVFNSCGIERFGGIQLLPRALNCLLGQTYKNFELIILDNQSTDDTGKVCKEYAKKDGRIRYVLDSKNRFAEGAITKLSTLAKGKYCLIANDDDEWDENYIEHLVNYLEQHPGVDLCYADCNFIDLQGKIVAKSLTDKKYLYNEDVPPLANYSQYAIKRNVLPMAFGVYKTEVFKKVNPFLDFDDLKANADNIFILKFFLLGFHCHRLPETMFFYRRRNRVLPKTVTENPEILNIFYVWVHYIRHQLLFYREMRKLIELTNYNESTKAHLLLVTLLSCLKFAIDSADEYRYHFINDDLDQDKFILARRNYFILKSYLNNFTDNKYCQDLNLIINGNFDALANELALIYPVFNNFKNILVQILKIEPQLSSSRFLFDIKSIFFEELQIIEKILDKLGFDYQTNQDVGLKSSLLINIREQLVDFFKGNKILYHFGLKMRAMLINLKIKV
jgi:glycosyltransferase involved in cell wall biosynthesis